MKKTIVLIILAFIAISWQSCTRTCVCEDANHKVKEIEIDPTENCKEHSTELLTCS